MSVPDTYPVEGRLTANPETSEDFLELVFYLAVIVSFEHTEEQALAEAARANEYQVVGLSLQQRNIHSLIYVILIFSDNSQEIRDSIRYSFASIIL